MGDSLYSSRFSFDLMKSSLRPALTAFQGHVELDELQDETLVQAMSLISPLGSFGCLVPPAHANPAYGESGRFEWVRGFIVGVQNGECTIFE